MLIFQKDNHEASGNAAPLEKKGILP